MISSCCLCVRCESRGLGSLRSPTPMVESFSADLLTVIESYRIELHLEFYQTSMTKLLIESMCSAFR